MIINFVFVQLSICSEDFRTNCLEILNVKFKIKTLKLKTTYI